jgi:GNAT superfamily N-acetyltransferase
MTGSRQAWPVELLADHAGCVDVLADWFAQEWAPYYGPGGPGDARADLAARCNRAHLPIGLVAIRDGRIPGTAALDRDTATGLTPSVVGLLVAPDCRGRGVASALLESAERLAGQLGYDELFISTSVLQVLPQRNGWQQTGDVEFLNNERGKVFVRHLTKSEST